MKRAARLVNYAEVLQERLARRDAALARMIRWLDSEATRAEASASTTRFETMKEAWTADAKNYRAMARDLWQAMQDGLELEQAQPEAQPTTPSPEYKAP